MDILAQGPWVLLLIGMALAGTAIFCAVRVQGQCVLTLLVFAALFGGLAVHGLPFVDSYGKLLDRIVQLGDLDAYLEAFGLIARGDLPPGYEGAILALAVEDASPQLQDALDLAIDGAVAKSGREALIEARASMDRHRHVADLVEQGLDASGTLTEAELESLPLPTRRLVVASILGQPDEEVRHRGLNPARLRDFLRTRE